MKNLGKIHRPWIPKKNLNPQRIAWIPWKNLGESTENCMDSLEKPGKSTENCMDSLEQPGKIHRKCTDSPRKPGKIHNKCTHSLEKPGSIHRNAWLTRKKLSKGMTICPQNVNMTRTKNTRNETDQTRVWAWISTFEVCMHLSMRHMTMTANETTWYDSESLTARLFLTLSWAMRQCTNGGDSWQEPWKIDRKLHGFPGLPQEIKRILMDCPEKPREFGVLWKFAEDPWMPSSSGPRWNNCEPSNM